MRDRYELDALIDELTERLDRDLSVLVVRHGQDLDARALGDLDVGDVVADVVGDGGQDPIAAVEVEGVEDEVPRAGGAGAEGDLMRMRADQLRRRAVEALDRLLVPSVRLVATDAAFELDVPDDGVENRLRRQRRAGVVQMNHVRAARRLAARPLDVDRHEAVLPTIRPADPSAAASCREAAADGMALEALGELPDDAAAEHLRHLQDLGVHLVVAGDVRAP